MAKTNIVFNNKNYSIDESSIASATASLKSHLSSVMNGSGATVTLDGTSYSIDSAKLAAATNAFVTHLGTVSGNGYKVTVGGVQYNVDSTKMSGAVSELEAVLGDLNSGEGEDSKYVAGLYQTGAIALYEAEGAEAIKDMLVTPWDELMADGIIVVDDTMVSVGYDTDGSPEKNEYGFFFDVSYEGVVFHEDGSLDMYDGNTMPAGTAIYGDNIIDMSAMGFGIGQVCEDGMVIDFGDFTVSAEIEEPVHFDLDGDLFMPDGNNPTSIGFDAFAGCTSLTGINIPDSVTSIGEWAFSGCTNLTSVNFGNGVTSIGEYAFANCASLTSVNIPDSVTSIDNGAFADCTSLTSINIPDSVTGIEDFTFLNCASLTSINIPDSVTSIKRYAFADCTNLKSVTFENADGWYVNTSADATSGTDVDVTDASTNVTYLTDTYYDYYWFRRES